MKIFFQLLLMVLPITLVLGRIHGGATTLLQNANQTDMQNGHFEAQSTIFGMNDEGEQQAYFDLGVLGHGGSGCPGGSVGVSESISGGNEATITLIFDKYVAETSRNRRRSRLSCNIALPVRVHPGIQIGVFQ